MVRLLTLGGVAVGSAFLRCRVRHIVVAGHSMAPTLRQGDRLLTVRGGRHPRPGRLALAPDPRVPDRLLIKRVAAVADGRVDLRGDDPHASTDSRTFGVLTGTVVHGVVAYRYFPVERAGWIS